MKYLGLLPQTFLAAFLTPGLLLAGDPQGTLNIKMSRLFSDVNSQGSFGVKEEVPVVIAEKFRLGNTSGSRNELIVPKICVPLIGCIPELRLDTRTGAQMLVDTQFRNVIKTDIDITQGAYDLTKASFDACFTVSPRHESSVKKSDDEYETFRILNESLALEVEEREGWIDIPSFKGQINMAGSTRTDASFGSYLGNLKADGAFTIGPMEWDYNLFDIDTAIAPPRFESPFIDLLTPFGPSPTVSGGLGSEFLFRKTFGPIRPGTNPADKQRIAISSISLLSPSKHFKDRATVKGNSVDYEFTSDIVRFAVDLTKLDTRLALLLTGRTPTRARHSFTYDLLSTTLGADIGYKQKATFTPRIGDRTLTCTSDAELHLSDGSFLNLQAGQSHLVAKGESLPSIRTLDGLPAEVRIEMSALQVTESKKHFLRLIPTGNLTLLPEISLQFNDASGRWKPAKLGPLSLSLKGAAHLGISNPFEIPLTDLPARTGDALTGDQTLVTTFTLPPSGETRGFSDTDNQLATVEVTHPITGESRTPRRITEGTTEQGIPLFADENEMTTLSLNDLDQLEVAFQDLQLNGFDIPNILQEVSVSEGSLLHVRHDLDSSLSHSFHTATVDGTLWFTPFNDFNAGDTLDTGVAVERIFQGKGTTVFETNTLFRGSFDAMPSSFTNESGHTLISRGSIARTRWANSPPPRSELIPTRFINHGRIEVQDSVEADMEFSSTEGVPHLNTGTILASGRTSDAIYSSFHLSAPHGLEQQGSLIAKDGGRIILDGSQNPFEYQNEIEPYLWRKDLNLFNASNDPALYRAEGDQAFLFLGSPRFPGSDASLNHGRPLVMTGTHRLEAIDNGTIRTFVFGSIFADDPVPAGRAEWIAGSGGEIIASGPSRFNGHIETDPAGLIAFRGLSAQDAGSLSIHNRGTMQFNAQASTLGTLNILPASQSNGVYLDQPAISDKVVGNLINEGTIELRENVPATFAVTVESFSKDGLIFNHGTWDLDTDSNLLIDLYPANNAETFEALEDDQATSLPPIITDLGGTLILRDTADFTTLSPDDRINPRNLKDTLRTIQGQLEINSYDISYDFSNALTNRGTFIIDSSPVFAPAVETLSGSALELHGNSVLNTGDKHLTVEGSTVTIKPGGAINGIGNPLANNTMRFPEGSSLRIASTRSVDETGMTDIKPATVIIERTSTSTNYTIEGELTLNGPEASFRATTSDKPTITIAGGILRLEDGASLIAQEIRVREGGKLIVGANCYLEGDLVETTDETGSIELHPEANLQIETFGLFDEDLVVNGRLAVNSINISPDRQIRGNGLLIGERFRAFSNTVFAPSDATFVEGELSYGTLDFFGEVIFEAESNFNVEVGAFEDGQFDRVIVTGKVEGKEDSNLQLPNLNLTFDPSIQVLPNLALPILTVRPSFDENDDQVTSTGVMKPGANDRPFFQILSAVVGPTGFKGPNEAGVNVRYAAQAPGGEFLGQLDRLDLFMFTKAGPDENNITLAFLDGTVTFVNGFQPEITPPVALRVVFDENQRPLIQWTPTMPGLHYRVEQANDLSDFRILDQLDGSSTTHEAPTLPQSFYRIETLYP